MLRRREISCTSVTIHHHLHHHHSRHDTSSFFSRCLVLALLASVTMGRCSGNNGVRPSFVVLSGGGSGAGGSGSSTSRRRQLTLRSPLNYVGILSTLRGGSTTAEADEDSGKDDADPAVDDNKDNAEEGGDAEKGVDENEDEDENDKNDEEEEDETEEKKDPLVKNEPVHLIIETKWGNSLLDHRLELMSFRTRDIAALKKSIRRSLPGRPPIIGLELVYEGRVLADEILVDELFDNGEEEEEEDGDKDDKEGPTRKLILNIVPPVDQRFGVELSTKLKADIDGHDTGEYMSTEELVEAYFMNQVAMARQNALLIDPNLKLSPMLRLEVQEEVKKLRDLLVSGIPADVWEKSLVPIEKGHNTEERRGQRYRKGKGGATTSLKTSIQRNLNINWYETINNAFLFSFFGYFGGRNSFSRRLLLWGAPMCFIVQARPVKYFAKILFYMLSNPPVVFLSLLPAPQQTILSMNLKEEFAALYGESAAEEAFPERAAADRTEVVDEEDEADEEVVDDDDDDDEEEVDGADEEEDEADEEVAGADEEEEDDEED